MKYILLLSLLCFVSCESSETSTTTPNVLFIAVDDLNDWVNCMGGREGVHTPNIDRLAKRGMLFTNAHCPAPSCNPSRVATMTGVAPYSSGIYNNRQEWRNSPRLKDAITLPEHFRNNGYTAAGAGKIFHALSWIEKRYGKQQNDASIWDHYWPSATKPMPDALWPAATKAKKTKDGYTKWTPLAGANTKKRIAHFMDFGPYTKDEKLSADSKVVAWTANQLMIKKDKPFFQAVGIFRPHIPWFAPKKYFDLYPLKDVKLPEIKENDLDDVPKAAHRWLRQGWHRWMLENKQWQAAVQGYLASISFADAQVGKLLDALDKSPNAKNTIIVLWSDHGMHIGEKRHWEKFTLFEESTRVPFMIIAPGVTKPGSVCDQPVNLLDIYPTLNELCGLPKRDDLDGQSLVKLLKNPNLKWEKPAITTWGSSHSARGQRYRYILHSNGAEQLYDHKNDPNEFTNLAANKKLQSVKDRLGKYLPKSMAKTVK
jgi:arylsulfatase A-like enzyme